MLARLMCVHSLPSAIAGNEKTPVSCGSGFFEAITRRLYREAAILLWLPATAVLGGLQMDEVHGQEYPNRTIRLVTNDPGGSSDFASRVIAQALTTSLRQSVIVENKGGGVIPGETVAKAAPNGYTLLVTGMDLWIAPLLKKVSYDPLKDFEPIALVVSSPNVLVTNPTLPVKAVKDLIALAKAKPGALNYASSSIGSSPHLAAELFKSMAGIDIVHVVYKSGGAAIVSLLGNQVQLLFASTQSAMPHIKSEKLRALAVSRSQPSPLLPGLPTVAETLPGYDFGGVTAVFAPPKTPAPIVTRLNQEIIKLLAQADVKDQFLKAGAETVGSSAGELTATVSTDLVKWGKVIKDAGIKMDD